ncbi:MAG: VOC family protein [Dehalococcoidales bacterium]|nr:VOC family protein [Dehalococcoidales bacterium]
MTVKLDHIGHIVRDFDSAMNFYKNKLGLEPNKLLEFSEFGSKMAFFNFAGIEIELIDPGISEKGPAARCLKERGEGIFHLSFRADDYDTEVKQWKDKGFMVEEFTNIEGDNRARLAFLKPEETFGLYIEFLKKEKI